MSEETKKTHVVLSVEEFNKLININNPEEYKLSVREYDLYSEKLKESKDFRNQTIIYATESLIQRISLFKFLMIKYTCDSFRIIKKIIENDI